MWKPCGNLTLARFCLTCSAFGPVCGTSCQSIWLLGGCMAPSVSSALGAGGEGCCCAAAGHAANVINASVVFNCNFIVMPPWISPVLTGYRPLPEDTHINAPVVANVKHDRCIRGKITH